MPFLTTTDPDDPMQTTTDPTHTTLSGACWNGDHDPGRCARSLADGDVCDCQCHTPDPTTEQPAPCWVHADGTAPCRCFDEPRAPQPSTPAAAVVATLNAQADEGDTDAR